MAFAQKLTLEWRGKKYIINVTMRTVDYIDGQMNLTEFVMRVASRDMRMSHAAHLISLLLIEGGTENITQDDVYDGMFGKGDVDIDNVYELINDIIESLYPPREGDEKKTEEEQATA